MLFVSRDLKTHVWPIIDDRRLLEDLICRTWRKFVTRGLGVYVSPRYMSSEIAQVVRCVAEIYATCFVSLT